MSIEQIVREIDVLHKKANQALKKKLFSSYMDIFANDLKYTQVNGSLINKQQLTQDVIRYFNRIKDIESRYERVTMSSTNDTFTEHLMQTATISIRLFVFFTKRWTLQREGVYHWGRYGSVWKIEKVNILSEEIY